MDITGVILNIVGLIVGLIIILLGFTLIHDYPVIIVLGILALAGLFWLRIRRRTGI